MHIIYVICLFLKIIYSSNFTHYDASQLVKSMTIAAYVHFTLAVNELGTGASRSETIKWHYILDTEQAAELHSLLIASPESMHIYIIITQYHHGDNVLCHVPQFPPIISCSMLSLSLLSPKMLNKRLSVTNFSLELANASTECSSHPSGQKLCVIRAIYFPS